LVVIKFFRLKLRNIIFNQTWASFILSFFGKSLLMIFSGYDSTWKFYLTYTHITYIIVTHNLTCFNA